MLQVLREIITRPLSQFMNKQFEGILQLIQNNHEVGRLFSKWANQTDVRLNAALEHTANFIRTVAMDIIRIKASVNQLRREMDQQQYRNECNPFRRAKCLRYLAFRQIKTLRRHRLK